MNRRSKILSTEEWIDRAIKKHGNKYSYKKSIYSGAMTKIIITCPHHGDFEQVASAHTNGKGCRGCADKKRFGKYTTSSFIKKAKEVHGDKYDYSLINYVNNSTKVEIICPVHGAWSQEPSGHLRGKGCKLCGNIRAGISRSKPIQKPRRERISNLNSFILKAKDKFGSKFIYDKAVFINTATNISIYCHIHGYFNMTPSNHLKSKTGCPSCGREYLENERRLNTNDFIRRAKIIHENKYGYDKVNYFNKKTRLSINCPKHGYFQQTAQNHLSGAGCHDCANDSWYYTTEDFINRANITHRYKYDYSKSILDKVKKKIKIICPIHGEFYQIAFNHMNGAGCPSCTPKGYNLGKSGTLYVLRAKEIDIIKIGISNQFEIRNKQLINRTPFEFYVFEKFFYEDGRLPKALENEAHKILTNAELIGFDGCSEWVILDEKARAWLKNMILTYNKYNNQMKADG